MHNHQQSDSPELTTRFTHAVEYVQKVHTGFRKGTQVPYMAHLLGVASLVLGETGCVAPLAVTEDIVIAALLHDAVEDEGGRPRLQDIEKQFGKEVAKIVEGCSDSFEEDSSRKAEWEARKTSYIARLRSEPLETLLVSAADKLYNARAIAADYKKIGPKVWTRFKRGQEHQLWYFHELIKVYEERCANWAVVQELKRTVLVLDCMCSGELSQNVSAGTSLRPVGSLVGVPVEVEGEIVRAVVNSSGGVSMETLRDGVWISAGDPADLARGRPLSDSEIAALPSSKS